MTGTTTRSPLVHAGIVLWSLFFAALVPWFVIRVQQSTHSDILWLCEALSRYFAGFRMSDAAYETNPPLSLLIYTLPVLAQSWLHISLHYAVFIQTCLLVAAGTFAVYRILSAWEIFDLSTVYIVTVGYVLANTVASSIYFGERDHLVGIFLVPFVLMQLSLTFHLKRPGGWTWPVFIIGTLLILLKPHHGLLPSLLLLHRLVLRKNLSFLRDPDFIALAVGTSSYVAFVILAFPDYVSIILPDVLRLYTTMGGWDFVAPKIATILSAGALLSVAIGFIPGRSEEKKLAWFMVFASVIGLIPLYVQGIGLYYHLMPTLSFIGPAIVLTLFFWLRTQITSLYAAALSMIFIVVLAFIYAPLNIGYPHHGKFAELPVAKILKKECPQDKPCSFLMLNRDMGILHETAYYTGAHHASRFPSMWFLPQIVRAQEAIKKGEPSNLTKEEVSRYYTKYSDMIAEDLATEKPAVILVWESEPPYMNIDFVPYFSQNKKFAREFKNYKKTRSVKLSYADYYVGTDVNDEKLTYDIYRRIKP